jgi:amino acid adenylation domain-containing protein
MSVSSCGSNRSAHWPHPEPAVLAASDQRPRWRAGERMELLFEQRCDATPQLLAVDPDTEPPLTFADLDARANRLARYLRDLGIGGGDRVGLLFDDAVARYTAMLAVLKAGSAFVPLGPGLSPDRVGYIVEDAEVLAVLTLAHLSGHFDGLPVAVVCVDDASTLVAGLPAARLSPVERDGQDDPLACILYTPGSTGHPLGVAIDQPGVVNFVRVAAELYGVGPGDRVYPGMTIDFGFSVEEIWVSWVAGATLVPEPTGTSLLGRDLHEYLRRRRVTAMCCMPTLLATIEEDLPGLRFLFVPGEICPADVATRWQHAGRRFLNTYGPTEATASATVATVDADRAVGIGEPLPTCSVVVLDPDDPCHLLERCELGELGIAGIGLARGYVNRDDLTVKKFVPDFLGMPANPSGRIFRTGDLCRITEQGEIEYHGRIDLRVQISGYRLEPREIEPVLLQVPGTAAAVVDTHEPAPGTVELVGYYSTRRDTPSPDPDAIHTLLRDMLPPYINERSLIQCHTLEDGVFTSAHTTVGAGATLGVEALLGYGVTTDGQAVIGLDSFPMTGEEVASRSASVGNSAWPAPETSKLPAPASARTRPATLLAKLGPMAAAAVLIAFALPAVIAVTLRMALPENTQATTSPPAASRVVTSPPSATGADDSHHRTEIAPAGVPKPPEEAGVSARPSTALARAGSAGRVSTVLRRMAKLSAPALAPMGPEVARVVSAPELTARTGSLQPAAPAQPLAPAVQVAKFGVWANPAEPPASVGQPVSNPITFPNNGTVKYTIHRHHGRRHRRHGQRRKPSRHSSPHSSA